MLKKWSNSSLIENTYKARYYKKIFNRKIKYITIHHMGAIHSAEGLGRIYQLLGRENSCHYGVGKDGEIALYVEEKYVAFSNRNNESNKVSIAVEICNSEIGGDFRVDDVVLNSAIKLIADIAKRNKLGRLEKGKTLCWHSMFANTECPGKYLLNKMDYICEKANEINGYRVKK